MLKWITNQCLHAFRGKIENKVYLGIKVTTPKVWWSNSWPQINPKSSTSPQWSMEPTPNSLKIASALSPELKYVTVLQAAVQVDSYFRKLFLVSYSIRCKSNPGYSWFIKAWGNSFKFLRRFQLLLIVLLGLGGSCSGFQKNRQNLKWYLKQKLKQWFGLF